MVAQGESVGKVGNTGTCSQGAHLHLTMSPLEGGWASGTTVDPYEYIQSHLTCNIDPKGSLMSVDCEQIFGWAQDPDTPEQDISTRLFFDGPSSDPNAANDMVPADREHGALCEVIDSCDHGFTMPSPYSLFDGVDHAVHVYGIDSGTNEAIELGGSPKTLACLPALDGLRRTIADPEVLAAWKQAKAEGLSGAAMTARISGVIAAQVAAKDYVSKHLREGAVDVRCSDMSSAERGVFKRVAKKLGIAVVDESRTATPHFHLNFV